MSKFLNAYRAKYGLWNIDVAYPVIPDSYGCDY